MCKKSGMDKNWFTRLATAIEADTRSKRDISLAAKLGPNYVQQMLKNGKQPTVENLMSLLEVLGYAKMFFVLTGVEFDDEDEEFIRVAMSFPPGLRRKLKGLLLEVEAEVSAEQPASDAKTSAPIPPASPPDQRALRKTSR